MRKSNACMYLWQAKSVYTPSSCIQFSLQFPTQPRNSSVSIPTSSSNNCSQICIRHFQLNPIPALSQFHSIYTHRFPQIQFAFTRNAHHPVQFHSNSNFYTRKTASSDDQWKSRVFPWEYTIYT